jgi:hypothetical protein
VVRYVVRQRSILGPVLFLVLISAMAKALRIGDDENVVYADNTTIWQTGSKGERGEHIIALFVYVDSQFVLHRQLVQTQIHFLECFFFFFLFFTYCHYVAKTCMLLILQRCLSPRLLLLRATKSLPHHCLCYPTKLSSWTQKTSTSYTGDHFPLFRRCCSRHRPSSMLTKRMRLLARTDRPVS